jgi:hypothetical protein
MVKKSGKSVKKKVESKKKKIVRASSNEVIATSKKFQIVSSRLVFFAILFFLSFILYTVSTASAYRDFFFLTSLIFGFVSIALFLVYLILLFIRGMNE